MPEASSSWKPASLQLIAVQPRLPLAACNHEGSVGIIEWQALPWRNRASASWNFVAPHRPAPLSRSVNVSALRSIWMRRWRCWGICISQVR